MKNFILLLFLVFSINTFGQVSKLRTTSYSSKTLKNNIWTEWNELTSADILITVDEGKSRIIIYSNKTQVYDIAKKERKTIDEDGDVTFHFQCVNQEGLNCRIRLLKMVKTEKYQLYVDFSDLKFVYNFYFLD